MAIVIGSHGLIEDDVVWKVAAGADAYAGPFVLVESGSGDVPVDLTDYEAGCQVRARLGGNVLATLTSEGGQIAIDGPNGEVLVHLPADQSREWLPRQTTAVFDVELYSPGGGVQRLCSGVLDIKPNVTVEEAP